MLDLEWNRSFDKIPLDEILQIGAVRLDRLGGRVTDSFCACVKPKVHHHFDIGAKHLPRRKEAMASTLDFATALDAFLDWCGAETQFASWGGDDFTVLHRNCRYWGLKRSLPQRLWDLQSAFCLTLGCDRQLALHQAVEYCGIPPTFPFHDALYDALYAAIVGEWVSAEALRLSTLSPRARRLTADFPHQPRRRVGPFASPQAALNSRECRKATCPLCGAEHWVLDWMSNNPRQFFADFQCPGHGTFPLRLTLHPMEDGHWQGRVALPPVTPILRQSFDEALKGTIYPCKSRVWKRKRRYRQRNRAAQPAT